LFGERGRLASLVITQQDTEGFEDAGAEAFQLLLFD
jgi:hypothetical protein